MVALGPLTKPIHIPGGISDCRLVSGDGRRILVVSRTHHVWLLDVQPENRTAKVIRTPVLIDSEARPELHASHDLSRLFIVQRDAAPRVVALPSGKPVYPAAGGMWATLPDWQCTAWSLTPDGRYVIELNAGQSRLRDLDGTGELGPAFDAWHWCEKDAWSAAGRALQSPGPDIDALYLDHVDDPLTYPAPRAPGLNAPFYLFAPCYGFVVSHVAAIVHMPLGAIGVRVPGRTRTGPAPVYDPSKVVRPRGFRHGFVIDQFRSGLTALDPKTGRAQTFPRLEPHWYGDIYTVVPCVTAPWAWVDTKHGTFLWRLDGRKEACVPLPDSPQDIVALYSSALLSAGPNHLFWTEMTGIQ